MLQLSQNLLRDLWRCELAPAQTDPNDPAAHFAAPNAEGKEPRLSANVLNPLAHETFDRIHGATRVGEETTLGFAADVYRVVAVTDTTDGTSASPFLSRMTTGTPSLT